MLTIILFIIVLSVLVFVHELGHFITAKRAGVRIEEFSIGFPPRLWSTTRGETRYSIGAIPFGGWVKMYGEDESELNAPGSFGALSLGKRALVLAAGVLMNLLLAVVLMSVVAAIGQPSLITDENRAQARDAAVTVIGVAPDSPAQSAGIQPGDKIQKISADDAATQTQEEGEFVTFLQQHEGEEVQLDILRGDETVEITATLRESPGPDEGALGVALAPVGIIRAPLWLAPWEGIKNTVAMTAALGAALEQIGGNIGEGKGLEGLSGPVGIATLTGDAARLGIVYFLQFTAFLSLNLAILNILPFPALDGGRLVFLLIEKVKGTPVTPKIEQWTHGLGFALLMLLIIWITFKDIARLL